MNFKEGLLRVENLTKVFKTGGILLGVSFAAVNNVSFDVMHQEVFCLVGESGSGKTTLGKMILGIVEPTSGRIYYKGRRIDKISSKREKIWYLKEVQPVFQNPFESFNPLKKVETYLFETAFNRSLNRDATEKLVKDTLTSVGLSLDEVRGKYPFEFSGGQLQRISIARALISNPCLLVADEPVSMVDASLRMSIVNLLRGLKEERGISVIYITHDLATAYYVGDRVAVMYRGDILEIGFTEEIFLTPLHPYTKLLLDSIPTFTFDENFEERNIIKLPSLEVKEFTKLGCKFFDRCVDALNICQEQEPPTVFIDRRMVKCHRYKGKNIYEEVFIGHD